jgi:hypothetical protein
VIGSAVLPPQRKGSKVNTIKRAGVALGICAGLVSMSGVAHAVTVTAPHEPAGYTIAYSGQITAPPYSQTHGSATCPGAKVPASGGLANESAGLASGVNSSYPEGHTWQVDFNNQSSTSSGFIVYAICLAPNAGRRVVLAKNISLNNGYQSGMFKACPVNTKVIGGGASSPSYSWNVSINDSYPTHNGWRVDYNNLLAGDTEFNVFVVCEPKPAGYSIHTGPLETAWHSQTSLVEVPCGPSATNVAIGGGMYTTSADTSVQMYDSFPNSTGGWVAHLQNNTLGDTQVEGFSICAGI